MQPELKRLPEIVEVRLFRQIRTVKIAYCFLRGQIIALMKHIYKSFFLMLKKMIFCYCKMKLIILMLFLRLHTKRKCRLHLIRHLFILIFRNYLFPTPNGGFAMKQRVQHYLGAMILKRLRKPLYNGFRIATRFLHWVKMVAYL